jgi:uncharacterized protein YdeI (YjbR/CyaY-like superfamily)
MYNGADPPAKMKTLKTFPATDRESWRAWLAENHASEREVWVVFPKKQTGELCMSYEESVEEALCHGWIDSLVKRMDEKTYARKFTPRTNNQNWSELNKRRVAKLIQEGRMTEIGLAKVNYSNAELQPRKSKPEIPSIPAFVEQGLLKNKQAWENFMRLAPSHKRNYVLWISSAKREETRAKRLQEAIQLLIQNKKLGLK